MAWVGNMIYGPGGDGIVFVLLLIIDVVLDPSPNVSDPASTVVTTFVQHRDAIFTATYIQVVAIIPFFIFLATLRSFLRRAEGVSAFLSPLVFVAGISAGLFVLIHYGVNAALASSATPQSDPALISALHRMGSTIFLLSDPLFATFLAPASLILLRTRALPRWLGWLGLVGAFFFFMNIFSLPDPQGPLGLTGLLGFLVFLVWVLAVSIFVFRRAGMPATAGVSGE